MCHCRFRLLTLQGQCKPNAESLLYAEVQPVLAFLSAKLRTIHYSLFTFHSFREISMRHIHKKAAEMANLATAVAKGGVDMFIEYRYLGENIADLFALFTQIEYLCSRKDEF